MVSTPPPVILRASCLRRSNEGFLRGSSPRHDGGHGGRGPLYRMMQLGCRTGISGDRSLSIATWRNIKRRKSRDPQSGPPMD